MCTSLGLATCAVNVLAFVCMSECMCVLAGVKEVCLRWNWFVRCVIFSNCLTWSDCYFWGLSVTAHICSGVKL